VLRLVKVEEVRWYYRFWCGLVGSHERLVWPEALWNGGVVGGWGLFGGGSWLWFFVLACSKGRGAETLRVDRCGCFSVPLGRIGVGGFRRLCYWCWHRMLVFVRGFKYSMGVGFV
jgi:hypothetical protein